jgi:hypothetical protein
MDGTLIAHCGTEKIGREELALVPYPAGSATHKVIPHHEVINALVDTLSLRHIAPVREEYAVSKDGMKMFGIMEVETTFQGCRFALGIRNAHDKSMRLAMTVGYTLWQAHHNRYYAQQIVMRSSPNPTCHKNPFSWANRPA